MTLFEMVILTYAIGTFLDVINWYSFKVELKKDPTFYDHEANEVWRFFMWKIGITPSIVLSNIALGLFLFGAYSFVPSSDVAVIYVYGFMAGVLAFNAFHDLYLIGSLSKPQGEKK